VKWVKDHTGRFAQRPHYLPEELDAECEKLITDFLRERHGVIEYPIRTDDLTVLIETLTEDLDLYADLSVEEGEVEGVTDFFPGRRPKVRISKHLAVDPRMSNRFRTTLTHELGHVKFHAFMFDGPSTGSLFTVGQLGGSHKCKRANMLQAPQTDWMEWQAGFACGALLMPATALRKTLRQFMQERDAAIGQFALRSADAEALVASVSMAYAVSREAARVRLSQHGALTEAPVASGLF
jgi:hypothetical protein